MLMWLRALSGWKLVLFVAGISAAATGSAGFVAGKKWERADRYEQATDALVALQELAQESLDGLNQKWLAAVAQAQVDVEEWSLQNQMDVALIEDLLRGQANIRSEFRDLENKIQITTDIGTCVFSADAIRLLNTASDAANAARTGAGGESGVTEEIETGGSDGGV